MDQAGVIALFEHGYWVRDRLLEAAATLTSDEWLAPAPHGGRGLRETLVHDLDTEWSWRLRLQGAPRVAWGPDVELQAADYPTVDTLTEHWRRDEAAMRSWLTTLDDGTLDGPATPVADLPLPLWTYVLHISIHGVSQRADAATMLTAAGASPGGLDILDWARATQR